MTIMAGMSRWIDRVRRAIQGKRRPLTSAEYDKRFGAMPEHLTARASHVRQGTEPLTAAAAAPLLAHLPTDSEG